MPNGDELEPVCPQCNTPYGDGAIFSVKNYPDDGGALLFLECEGCKYEAQIDFDWKKHILDPTGKEYVVLPRSIEEE